ncbi:amino acid adenylation domain-containing protein [Pseudoalteromonas sp. JBTF-M23]|uniref:Amino acid adenylation domain-containing protein n=1 Tax=Pseudoalteromonas caenipelagi TaxID=2726988 RepID=A0A849VGH4_9GAMM|nr:non-ribosomal peptide synthetase [Pseudoalteromonas caenipelagi]NOU50974.1 amino acid adenylation domain-containing protein [Pseudoalteromonas caenipelagi]
MQQSQFLSIAQRLNKLEPKQQQQFRQKLAQQGINSWKLPIVETQLLSYPLSVAQQRFLVAEKMAERALYNLCSVVKFDLKLNPQALAQALTQLVNRHQVMTTCFKQNEQGNWYSYQQKNVRLDLTPVQLTEKQNRDQDAWLSSCFAQQQNYQFDLSNEAPFQVSLYQGKAAYWLFVTIHHVAFDAWSFDIFNQELVQLYDAIVNRQNDTLAPLSIQYHDYAAWQNQWLKSEDYQAQQDYWQQQLRDLPPALTLPFDFSVVNQQRTFAGQIEQLTLDTDTSAIVRRAITQHNTTLYVYLQTVFAWLLGHYSDQHDFCFGSSIANRTRPELSHLVGPLLNTLVLRHSLNPTASFKEALTHCLNTSTAAFDNQDFPFEHLASLLGGDHDVPTQQLFNVMFIHVGLANQATVKLAQSHGTVLSMAQNSARFDLTLRVLEQNDQTICLDLEFSTERFLSSTIKQLLTDFEAILNCCLSNPNTTFADVSSLLNKSKIDGPALHETPKLLTERIRQFARQNNEATNVALLDAQQRIHYSQLEHDIESTAIWLQQRGIKAHQHVAIIMPRTALQVTLMLASWRLGAVCVMLDPKQPDARLAQICHDAEVKLILSDKRYDIQSIAQVSQLTREQLICEQYNGQCVNDAYQLTPQDPAYILYTSGSTGKPKGVVVSHQAISHYAAAIAQQYPQPAGSRWLTLATVAADLGLTSVLGALYQGQCLVLPCANTIADPNALADFLARHPADCLKITPSHLNALLSVKNPAHILPKHTLFLGGEGLNQGVLARIKALSPKLNVVNHYGPSESTVGISATLLDNTLQSTLSPVAALGSPLPGNSITVRNSHGQLLPRGAIGELCVSGSQLAQGYWQNPAQTALQFVQPEDGPRYYKTGDLARINHFGLLEFMGRSDDQVKRRGYRIELNEISQWLCQQPHVSNAIVLLQKVPESGKEQLISWLTLEPLAPCEQHVIDTLKHTISGALPDYMHPDHWLVLESLPLNNNGKIDRKALPLPSVNSPTTLQSNRALSEVEQVLANIWQTLLNVDQIQPSDDFFALGGDSIMSLQMIGLAANQGVKLMPKDIITHRLLANIAAAATTPLSKEIVTSHNDDIQLSEQATAYQETILALFKHILRDDSLSAQDSFYTRGGDSILSLQFIALAKQQDLSVTPKQLQQNPTAQLLALSMCPSNSDLAISESLSKMPDKVKPSMDLTQAHPLSAAQKRIWFLQQLEPQNTAYNLPAAFKVTGNIDLEKLADACQQLVEKHWMLRTQYITGTTNDSVLQRLVDTYQPLTVHAAMDETTAQDYALQLVRQPFDLSTGKVLSINLLPITHATDCHILVFNIHHIATDGWSMGILIQDLLKLYQTGSKSTPHSQEQISYFDYCIRQQAQNIDDSLFDYWLTRLKNMPQQLALSYDKPLPSQQSYAGATQEWPVNAAIIEQLDGYANTLNTTPFSLLLAGFQLLMWRYTQQNDFAVGIPVSGREDTHSQHIVGVFINTLIHRARIQPDLATSDWLTQHIEALQSDLAHQSMPLETLFNALQPARNLARPAVFQVLFNYQNDQLKQRDLSLPGLHFEALEHNEVNTKFELSFNLLRRDNLVVQIEYNRDLFTSNTIEQLFEDYLSILSWLPTAQQTPLSALTVSSADKALSAATTEQLVANLNREPLTEQADFITRFEQHVAQQGLKTAVIACGQHYNYKQLNHDANQLAHFLKNKGIGAEQLVAFCLPRGYQMLVTMLAIQKAGGAYLPLDSTQPAARLSYIIEHAQPQILLTQTTISRQLESDIDMSDIDMLGTDMPILNLDLLNSQLSELPCHNLHLATASTQLAYTLYTSGSTGKPKGVEIERGNFACFLKAIEHTLPRFKRTLALTTITFDIAGLELCLPLATGTSVVIANEDQQKDPQQLFSLIEKYNIDLVQATPATWSMMTHDEQRLISQQPLARVNAVCGGESLSSQLAVLLKQHCMSVTNVYGPTETTIWSSAYPIQQLTDKQVPIGNPIAYNHFYVLDPQKNLTPFGIPGELYIGGPVVARGYRHDTELTQAAFIEHPDFGRLYKTGDKVQWTLAHSSPVLRFIGRTDFQLKHRGYRIESGEIEHALTQHTAISQAVVVIKEQLLVAYYVVQPDAAASSATASSATASIATAPNIASLKQYLSKILPDYMVPQHLQMLDELPVNSNGKVDRSALPAIKHEHTSSHDTSRALTMQEEKLAGIWKSLLKVDHLQSDDDFFLLGGHSLLAAQLRAQLNKMDLNIPLKSLFEQPTLAEQAKLLSESKYQKITLLCDLDPTPTLLPLSSAQKRVWFMQQLNPTSAGFNMHSAVRIKGALSIFQLKQAILLVTQKHPILQVTYHQHDEQPVQKFNPTLDVTVTICDLSNKPQQLEQQLADAANQSFNLEVESPLRVLIYQMGNEHFVCQLIHHHIASDAWSMTLLLDDLMDAYQQLNNTSLEALRAEVISKPSYLDYAYWQNTPLIMQQQQASIDYWRQTLAGAKDVLVLPFDRPRDAAAQARGGCVEITIDRPLLTELKNLAHQQQSSLFMLLISAYSSLIFQQTKCQDMIIGTDVANREHVQTHDMLGFFVNLLPLRLKPKATLRFNDFLQQVKQHCLDGFEHQSVPFEQIVETIKPTRINGMHPLIQALFVMQNTPDTQRNISNLHIEPLRIEQQHAKFDCALFANEDKHAQSLLLSWVFNSQLFDKSTIELFSQQYIQLLRTICKTPNAPLNNLLTHNHVQKEVSDMPTTSRPAKLNKLNKFNKLNKLKNTVPDKELVKAAPLNQDRPFPLLVQCQSSALDPLSWARQNQTQIMNWLQVHGGIVFRGFNLPTALEFEQFCLAIYPQLYAMYGDLPKNDIGNKIYKSTPYPNEQMIMYHNESSHQSQWPRRQWFYCSQNAAVGGATPIVDCREMYLRLPAHIKEKLETKQLCYIRNFSSLDVSWQHFFKTHSRQQVESICKQNGIDFHWYGDDNLRISQICPAVITHPITHEKSFFNQIQLHHYSFLEEDVKQHFLETGGIENLPRNVCYGDQTPLEQEVIDVISELYEACAVRFDWQKADVVMLDNMLAAHARDPFEGERKIAVAMGDIYQVGAANTQIPEPVQHNNVVNNSQLSVNEEQA